MRTFKLIIGMMLLAVAAFAAGCAKLREGYEAAFEPAPVINQPEYSDRKFTLAEPPGPTAVQSAVELSEKYVRLSELMAGQQLKSQALDTENAELKRQIAVLEKDLTQAQKELSEANQLLLDMRVELGDWKYDVLGFRDEMRDAQRAQLQALTQILEVLGAEVIAESAVVSQPAALSPKSPEKQVQ
jgi:septal ring factor EnvC (AmiA/AmiB activator)